MPVEYRLLIKGYVRNKVILIMFTNFPSTVKFANITGQVCAFKICLYCQTPQSI